jgi:hypothetical protein
VRVADVLPHALHVRGALLLLSGEAGSARTWLAGARARLHALNYANLPL